MKIGKDLAQSLRSVMLIFAQGSYDPEFQDSCLKIGDNNISVPRIWLGFKQLMEEKHFVNHRVWSTHWL